MKEKERKGLIEQLFGANGLRFYVFSTMFERWNLQK